MKVTKWAKAHCAKTTTRLPAKTIRKVGDWKIN